MHILYLCILNVLFDFAISSFVSNEPFSCDSCFATFHFAVATWLKIYYFTITLNINDISETYNVCSNSVKLYRVIMMTQFYRDIAWSCQKNTFNS